MKKTIFACFLLALASCTLKEQEKVNTKTYFDLAGYFKQEASRLAKTQLTINKMVVVNGKSETRAVKIQNWEKEFDLFVQADINKASWRGSFTPTVTDNLHVFTSQSQKIPVKKVEISYQGNKVSGIKVFVTNANDLYTSNDSLSYYPDSLYQIKKVQHIKLMAEKRYEVSGKFK